MRRSIRSTRPLERGGIVLYELESIRPLSNDPDKPLPAVDPSGVLHLDFPGFPFIPPSACSCSRFRPASRGTRPAASPTRSTSEGPAAPVSAFPVRDASARCKSCQSPVNSASGTRTFDIPNNLSARHCAGNPRRPPAPRRRAKKKLLTDRIITRS